MATIFISSLDENVSCTSFRHAIARLEIFDYIEVFYNRLRIHSALGNLSPMEFKDIMQQEAVPRLRQRVNDSGENPRYMRFLLQAPVFEVWRESASRTLPTVDTVFAMSADEGKEYSVIGGGHICTHSKVEER